MMTSPGPLKARVRAVLGATRSAAVLGALVAAAPVMAAVQLNGAGSTFVYPFFSKAFYEYTRQHPDVAVNYQSIGSGGGIEQFIKQTVDFGATDVPMNADELKRASGPVLQIPVTLGGEAIAYNVPGVTKGLHMTPDLIAQIYLGKITKWDDRAIRHLNPSAKLPDMPIVVVHRSDGSGTTYIFTDFLSTVSPEWQQKVGKGKSVQWPAGVGGKGNEGVAGQVSQAPGAIGYVELAYALQNKMTYAQVANRSGKFLYPSLDTVKAAAASKPHVTATDFSIVYAPGADSYPISGYSWVILHRKPQDVHRAAVVKAVMEWLVTKGQADAESVEYVPLPENIQQQDTKALAEMQL